jgi:hypothetical protein
MRRRALVVAVTAVLSIVPTSHAAGAGSIVSAWSIVPTPNDMTPRASFREVSCSAADACTAVGTWVNRAGIFASLAERWNGTSWSVQSTPDARGAVGNALSGVFCAGPSWCMAVGDDISSAGARRALAERWDGTVWTIEPSPNPSGAPASFLSSVACTAVSACTAVGFSSTTGGASRTLAERWNGSTWAIQSTPNPGTQFSSLAGIACTSATACTAVGAADGGSGTLTLAEHWDGTAWSVQPTPAPVGAQTSSLSRVSCPAPAMCTAVGSYFPAGGGVTRTLAERWNGTTWMIQPTVDPAGSSSTLLGVACPSSTSCFAVGDSADTTGAHLALAERWNGISWTRLPTPATPSTAILNGVACPATASCRAVGFTYSATSAQVPLAEGWGGTAWSREHVPVPIGVQTSELSAVACSAAGACTAVGSSLTPGLTQVTLAERWGGGAWSMQATPTGAFNTNLTGVSCPATTSCTAVGYIFTGGYGTPGLTFAERWGGATWSIGATPNPSGAIDSALSAINCTGVANCMAVGSYTTTALLTYPLTMRWDGTSWKTVPTPTPVGANGSGLSGVSCSGATACTAVGWWFDGSVTVTLAERWDGSQWVVQPTPNPGGQLQNSVLEQVACAAATACTAIGRSDNGAGSEAPLGEQWDGPAWALAPIPAPPGGGSFSRMSGVACAAASACVAVGTYATASSANRFTLVDRWNGSAWTVQPTPNPAGPTDAALSGAACTSVSACLAVGSYGRNFVDQGTPELTLAERG